MSDDPTKMTLMGVIPTPLALTFPVRATTGPQRRHPHMGGLLKRPGPSQRRIRVPRNGSMNAARTISNPLRTNGRTRKTPG